MVLGMVIPRESRMLEVHVMATWGLPEVNIHSMGILLVACKINIRLAQGTVMIRAINIKL